MKKSQRRPEDLGAMGQSYFKQLAKDAGLVANESNDDKAGWDYEIEHPSPRIIDYSSQSKPIYRIQVKSTENGSLKVRISFSSLISLIQFNGPAFIFLVCYQNNISPVGAYLLHIDEAHARNVLQLYRKKEVKGSTHKLNKAKATVIFDQNSYLSELSGACLKRKLDTAVPGSYLDYVKNKANWLQKIERDSDCWHFNLRFEDEDAIAAMANCFLGYPQPINMATVKYKAPMGIAGELPPPPQIFKPGLVKPIEENLEKVIVRLGYSEYAAKYEFSGVIYVVPKELPPKFAAMRIKTALFDVLIRLNGEMPQFKTVDLLASDLRAPLKELHGLLTYIKDARDHGTTYFSVDPVKTGASLKLTFDTPPFEIQDDFDQTYGIFDAAYSKLARLGLVDKLIRPSVVHEKLGHFQLLQICESTYNPEYVLDFPSDNEPNGSINTVLFSSSIELEGETALFHSAFFGNIERIDVKTLRGRFIRSELLEQNVIPSNADIHAIQKEIGERIKHGLQDRGFSVL